MSAGIRQRCSELEALPFTVKATAGNLAVTELRSASKLNHIRVIRVFAQSSSRLRVLLLAPRFNGERLGARAAAR